MPGLDAGGGDGFAPSLGPLRHSRSPVPLLGADGWAGAVNIQHAPPFLHLLPSAQLCPPFLFLLPT